MSRVSVTYDNHIAHVRLTRADKMNAVDQDMIDAVIAAVVAVLFGGREGYIRLNYVYSYDSRINADLITVSSRVAGWVTSLKVTEGSKITKAMVLLTIDSR